MCSIPIVVVLGVLLYLHRRGVKREKLEDVQDTHKSMDFGTGETGKKKLGRKSFMLGGGEKGMGHSKSQLSMDMNLSSPYLLPPGLQQSRESLHSLARSLGNDHEDRYQYVATYVASDAGSLRSFNPNKDNGSMYTKTSSKRFSAVTGKSFGTTKMGPRQNSFPKSPTTPSPSENKKDPFATPTVPEPAYKGASPVESHGPIVPVKPIIPEIGSISDYGDKDDIDTAKVPVLQQPPPAKAKDTQTSYLAELPGSSIGMAQTGNDFPLPPNRNNEPAGLGLNFDFPQQTSPAIGVAYDEPRSAPIQGKDQQDNYDYHEYQPQNQSSDYYGMDDYEDYGRGRSAHRPGSPNAETQQHGLGVPQQETKRLSVGFRPLPPDEITESEDPEYRANRIRSFYKEYFDDSKEAPPPMPALPAQHQQQQQQHNQHHNQQGSPQYYEDYDQGYLGDAAAYFDPDSNAFVMPYAEPVTRRAMTPPPSGNRFRGGPGGPGPRGPQYPHGPHGSVGGMSMQGGPRGRPRAGSAYGPRAPSGAGSRAGSRAGSSIGPRPDSSASNGRWRQPPKKKGPPPAALTTLPTPSKLRDDSFAIMGAIDFAPPETFKDQAAGRSQSPLGERRVYSPRVPVATPLVTAFDELSALPSP